ncbi:MAG: accessory factor UbiK family protein [Betaproteobacteria bacterium]|jgi:BMFP domain-containing protein YqiC
MNTQSMEELAERLRALLARSPAADLDRNLRALLGHWFSRLDLVSREEFDIQREVLARTRARVAELERQLAQLEDSAARSR